MTGKGKDKHEGRHPEEERKEPDQQAEKPGSGEERAAGQELPKEAPEPQGGEVEKAAASAEAEAEKETGVPGPAEAGEEAVAEGKPEVPAEAGREAAETPEEVMAKALADAEAKLAGWRERYLRLAADFDNFRKRQMKERAEMLMTANEGLVVELLPVLDNMERAISALPKEIEGDSNFESIRKGVELTLRLFQAVLVKYGVEKMTVVGKKFDPFKHEALTQEDSADVTEETVIEEIESGYVLNGKVVRPAKVRVAKPKP